MNILGIDPGKSGAAALLGGDGYLLKWFRTPVVAKEYSGAGIQEIMELMNRKYRNNLSAWIEFQNGGSYGGGRVGATSTFQTGLGYGRWLQALEGNDIPYRIVTPAMWMKKFASKAKISGKERKAYHVLLARLMWPASVPWDKLPKDAQEGIAEASLIAEYGRTN